MKSVKFVDQPALFFFAALFLLIDDTKVRPKCWDQKGILG
jgi:hypothetical protein